MEKITRVAMLYDFYGKLLTEKQKQYIEFYYNFDLSLGEIAEELKVSRQAVHDNLKRAEKSLEEYELKLGLVQKFMLERTKLNEIFGILKDFQKSGQPESIGQISRILDEILELENN